VGFPNRRRRGERIYTYGAHPYQFAWAEDLNGAWTLGWADPSGVSPRLGLMLEASRLHISAGGTVPFDPRGNSVTLYGDETFLMTYANRATDYYPNIILNTGTYYLAGLPQGFPAFSDAASACVSFLPSAHRWVSWCPLGLTLFTWPVGQPPWPEGGLFMTLAIRWGEFSWQGVWLSVLCSMPDYSAVSYPGHHHTMFGEHPVTADECVASVCVPGDEDTFRLFLFAFGAGHSLTYVDGEPVVIEYPSQFVVEITVSWGGVGPVFLAAHSHLGITPIGEAFADFNGYKHLENPAVYPLVAPPAFVPRAMACGSSYILSWGFVDSYAVPHYYAMLAGTDEADPGPLSEITGPITVVAGGNGYYSDGVNTYRWSPTSGSSTLIIADWAWPFPAPDGKMFVGRVEDGYHHPYRLADPETGAFL